MGGGGRLPIAEERGFGGVKKEAHSVLAVNGNPGKW